MEADLSAFPSKDTPLIEKAANEDVDTLGNHDARLFIRRVPLERANCWLKFVLEALQSNDALLELAEDGIPAARRHATLPVVRFNYDGTGVTRFQKSFYRFNISFHLSDSQGSVVAVGFSALPRPQIAEPGPAVSVHVVLDAILRQESDLPRAAVCG